MTEETGLVQPQFRNRLDPAFSNIFSNSIPLSVAINCYSTPSGMRATGIEIVPLGSVGARLRIRRSLSVPRNAVAIPAACRMRTLFRMRHSHRGAVSARN